MADWNKIRAEYIRGGTSYQKLAEKYGITARTVARHAEKEKWVDKRREKDIKLSMKLTDIAANSQSEAAKIIFDAALDLARKVAKSIEQQEVFLPGDAYGYANAMQKIKQTIGIKDDIDLEEQKMRIEKLRKEAQTGADDAGEGRVVVIPARVMIKESAGESE